jgi:hypothetical protein
MIKHYALICLALFLFNAFVESKLLQNVKKAPGSVFPKPQVQAFSNTQFKLNSHSFAFVYKPGSVKCSLLTEAFDRIYRIIFKPYEYAASINKRDQIRKKKMFFGDNERLANFVYNNETLVNNIEVNIDNACEDYPTLDSDESCK